MKKTSVPVSDSVALRQKAEARLSEKSTGAPSTLSEPEMLRLIHELQVHQVELEIQDEELRRVMLSEKEAVKLTQKLEVQRVELESQKVELVSAINEAQDAIKLYDFAPIGYFTLTRESEILRLNVSGAKMLGKERSYFRNLRLGTFVCDESKPVFNLFIETLFASQVNESCEIVLSGENGIPLFVQLSGIATGENEQCLVTATDITARKQSEMALLVSEARYRMLFEMSPSGISLYDENGIIREANNAISKITQFSREELIGSDLRNLATAGNESFLEANVKRILAGETLVHNIEMLKKDGTQSILNLNEAAVSLPNGVKKILSIANDITERLRTEKALQESELRFKNVFDHHSAIMLLIDPESGMIEDANDVAADFYRYSKAMLKSMNIDEINILPKKQVKIEREKAIKMSLNYFVFQHRLATGEERTVEVHSSPICIQEKEILFSIIHDITDRKKLENKLATLAIRNQTLINTSSDGIHILDKLGNVVEANDAFCKMLGYTLEEMLQMNVSDWDMQWKCQELLAKVNDLIIHPAIFETVHRRKDGSAVDVEINAAGIILEGCQYQYAATRDISNRKQTELTLKKYNEELLKVNAEKDKFFSIIAHDLRGPIGGFMGLTERMAEGMADMTLDELQNMASVMKKSSFNLYNLMGNLLEWSCMQRGITTFEPVSMLLLPKIHENLLLAFDSADKKGIAIGITVPSDLEVYADGNLLASILRNLVTNAVKFTPKGGNINITAGSIIKGFVEVSITDTGIGMTKNIVENLFNLDVNTSRRGTDGELSTGLGLTICKDFVEKHGGKLKVDSEPGKGSTFSFTIPSDPSF